MPSRPSRTRKRRRASFAGVLGELLITAGVFILLFLGWQLWLNNLILDNQQSSSAAAQSAQWLQEAQTAPAPAAEATATEPPVTPRVGAAEPFAVVYIPRLGADWQRTIREGVDVETVLNSFTAGVGHYTNTQMPGEMGNFGIAGHDSGWGNTFIDLMKLQIGDKIYVQTQAGWYTYSFQNDEYVQPNASDVLLPVPRHPEMPADGRYITITTCNPPFAAAERLIAYGTFDGWQPLTDGAPAEIAAQVAANQTGA